MDVAERIGEANEKFKEAIRTADGDVMPSLYTSDAVIFPPNDGGTWKMHRDTWNSSVPPPQ